MVDRVDFNDSAWRAGLKRALNNIKDGSATAVYLTGQRAAADIKRRAPVDTGRLRSSYNSIPGVDGRGPFARVGSSVQYATYVEYGTLHQHAQPHFRPGILRAVELWAQAASQIRP